MNPYTDAYSQSYQPFTGFAGTNKYALSEFNKVLLKQYALKIAASKIYKLYLMAI